MGKSVTQLRREAVVALKEKTPSRPPDRLVPLSGAGTVSGMWGKRFMKRFQLELV